MATMNIDITPGQWILLTSNKTRAVFSCSYAFEIATVSTGAPPPDESLYGHRFMSGRVYALDADQGSDYYIRTRKPSIGVYTE